MINTLIGLIRLGGLDDAPRQTRIGYAAVTALSG